MTAPTRTGHRRGRLPRRAQAAAIRRTLLLGSRCVLVFGLCLLVGSTTATAATPSWEWPLPAPHILARPFIAPATPYAAGHRGIDIAGSSSASVLAPADGVVHFAGFVVDRPVLSLRHPNGLISSYEPVTSPLTEGMTVREGDALGTLEPGHCASPCLHFGVRLYGQYISPLNMLGGIPRSVLLPTRQLR